MSTTRAERIDSWSILILLAVTVLAVAPRRWRARPVPAAASRSVEPGSEPHLSPLRQLEVPGFVGGEPEWFRLETVYEKINGKIEFYQPLGFRSLAARRYLATGSDHGLEILIFDLGTADRGHTPSVQPAHRPQRECRVHCPWTLLRGNRGPSADPALQRAVVETAERLHTALPGVPAASARGFVVPRGTAGDRFRGDPAQRGFRF